MPGSPLGVPKRNESVFINCAFDDDFRPLFDALVLAVVACGFTPRCALESGSVADLRMDRICTALLASKYSIHDLSRCQGEGDRNLARFNMPLELGMAIAIRAQSFGNNRHDWLVLVPERHRYSPIASDLAGFDAPCHRETRNRSCRRSWPGSPPEWTPLRYRARSPHSGFSESCPSSMTASGFSSNGPARRPGGTRAVGPESGRVQVLLRDPFADSRRYAHGRAPEITATPISHGTRDYLSWISEEASGAAETERPGGWGAERASRAGRILRSGAAR
jgi:hypothetical protein